MDYDYIYVQWKTPVTTEHILYEIQKTINMLSTKTYKHKKH